MAQRWGPAQPARLAGVHRCATGKRLSRLIGLVIGLLSDQLVIHLLHHLVLAQPGGQRSLPAVLDSLEADHDFLLEGGVFTEDLITTWIEYKREKGIKPLAARPHPFEYELYFGV